MKSAILCCAIFLNDELLLINFIIFIQGELTKKGEGRIVLVHFLKAHR